MRIVSLRLQNFRQHADTEVHFRPGLTGIIGPNGAGKSTLLEAIAWAIYGAEAARGTNDTLRFARAGARAKVEVELAFALGGHEYRVVRALNTAEVYLDGGTTPVATTIGGVSRYLQGRIGMSRREFFNTYFTGQKELQFLAAMGPTERGKFLSQVLGYERLRQAQDAARTRRNELRHEIAGLRAGLADLGDVRQQRAAAEERLATAQQALAAAESERASAAVALSELAPRWAAVQTARERHRELSHAVEAAEAEREGARRELLRIDAELARVAAAEAERAGLVQQLAALPGISAECARMAELARVEERRRALAEQVVELEAERARAAERIEKLAQAPELVERYAAELMQRQAEQQQLTAELEERKTAWVRDRQDAETKLQGYRDRGLELKEQIRQIREAGPEGACPTCARPLGKDFERTLDELEDQWAAVVQDGKWWKRRAEQLQAKPEEIAEAEAKSLALKAEIEEKARKHARCEAAVSELRTLEGEQRQREEKLSARRAELAELPAGYDPRAHAAAEVKLQALRALENQASRLEAAAARRGTLEQERADALAREADALARGQHAAEERRALGFAEAGFEALRVRFEEASGRAHHLELRATELRGQLNAAEEARSAAAAAEEHYHERAREVEQREDEFRHHVELDDALTQLRAELNAQVRPELSEIASNFLAQLTDGRYTALEIDDAYNLLVLDEGEEKPVISGGEEDVTNLVLRLSLSQMIAERAGHPLSLLVLDEVFGSLDLARRDNVVQLLRHLEDRFEQVILITHIEGIRESLDQVLRVEFDERTGSSFVREESFVGRAEVVETAGFGIQDSGFGGNG
jgi:exonuclease SbcC